MSSEETVPLWRQEFWAEMLCAGQPNETAICVYTFYRFPLTKLYYVIEFICQITLMKGEKAVAKKSLKNRRTTNDVENQRALQEAQTAGGALVRALRELPGSSQTFLQSLAGWLTQRQLVGCQIPRQHA